MSSLKMKNKFTTIKGVLDNFGRSISGSAGSPTQGTSGTGPVKLEQDIIENLEREQFTVENTIRHGFPFKPICMGFDPVQKLLAIGNRSGTVRIYGRPGVDMEIIHENGPAVLQIVFRINTGTLLTACSDDTINLWDFKKKIPELVQTLRLQRESLTVIYADFQDKWGYIGTEKGNMYIMNIETFSLSGYQIPWNKWIDPLSKGHPGAITLIQVNPADSSKFLVGFESGLMVVWDLPTKKGEQRYLHNHKLESVCWHMEGRQFVSSHGDGSLVTWNVKAAGPGVASCSHNKPASIIYPHGKKNKETGKMEPCDPIDKVLWRVNRSSGDSYFVFSGGLPSDVTGVTPSISMTLGKNTTLLEMEYCVLDFILATDSPYNSDYQEPEAIIAMLTNDVVAIDVKSNGAPCFKNPYAMDFNESPVTCCHYVVDCPYDVIPCLYMVGSGKKGDSGSGRNFSSSEWPISGGNDTGVDACSYTELVITGHADGSIRFWDSTSTTMQSLYRIKTAKYFEKVKKTGGGAVEGFDDDPYAIMNIDLCPESKILTVAGSAAHVIVFRFKKKETTTDTVSLEIPIIYEVGAPQPPASMKGPETSPPTLQHFEFPPRPLLNVASQSSSYTDPVDGFNFDKPLHEFFTPLRVRAGAQRKSPGYHAELVCLTPWVNGEPPSPLNCLTINSLFGLIAYGNGSGLVIVDIIQNQCLLNMGTADLYGSQDPFQRMPKSPRPFDPSPIKDEIVRVDLSNYSQVGTPDEGTTKQPAEKSVSISLPPRDMRVKSPDCKRLIKAGSSADDSSISKSQSSSVNSLDAVITSEGVTAVTFCDSFASKGNFSLNACLYVGTTLGSVVVVIINLPEQEKRTSDPVVVSPSGSVYRVRGPILSMCFMDASKGALCDSVNVKPTVKHDENNISVPTANTSMEGGSDSSNAADQQIAVICTEKSAAVFALPSQRQMYSQTINESFNVVRANIINFGGPNKYIPLLVTYTSDGHVKAFSLPSLRPMLDMNFVPESSKRIGYTMRFSDYGHGLYFCNPTECQKFSISSDFMRQLPDMTGLLFQDNIPMPDPPKQSFLKGIFGGGPKPLDREELFGETSGKVNANVAKHIPGSGMQNNMSKSIAATSEISKAKMAMVERGQKLNELEDRTEAMANEAKNYAANAQRLKQQYERKKWYHL